MSYTVEVWLLKQEDLEDVGGIHDSWENYRKSSKALSDGVGYLAEHAEEFTADGFVAGRVTVYPMVEVVLGCKGFGNSILTATVNF